LEIAQVGRSRLVARVEPKLLFSGQARHHNASEGAVGECLRRVVEVAARNVGLAPMSRAVERHRVYVHPSPAGRDEFDPDGPPVGFYGVTEQTQGVHRDSLALSVYS